MSGDATPGAALDHWARGELPPWSVVTERRYAHMRRVAWLMDRWAAEKGLDAAARRRWRLAGWLHDALRDAPPEQIRPWIEEPQLRAMPGSFLHGPAVAARLAADGVDDAELLDAIRYHTVTSPALGELGLALIVADALEPGRAHKAAWRAALRARMPRAVEAVARAVIGEKLERAIAADRWLRPEVVALWNRLAARAREGKN